MWGPWVYEVMWGPRVHRAKRVRRGRKDCRDSWALLDHQVHGVKQGHQDLKVWQAPWVPRALLAALVL